MTSAQLDQCAENARIACYTHDGESVYLWAHPWRTLSETRKDRWRATATAVLVSMPQRKPRKAAKPKGKAAMKGPGGSSHE